MRDIISFIEFREMVAESLGLDGQMLTREVSLRDDFGVDSLSVVNFIIKLERQFNLMLKLENIWELKTFGEMYEWFLERLSAR